ncbi:hypothetical protein ACFYO7_25095 [Nocardia salmonicida]|uniref:hypothetical protein n=1 Tax=Nocardia salmonicida TaxID=53431 RepID=UPI0036B12676
MLAADIVQINEVANKLEGIGNEVDALDIRSSPSPSLPGTDISALCANLSEHTEGAYLRVAERLKMVAAGMRTCASDLSMTDAEFASSMNGMDFTGTSS